MKERLVKVLKLSVLNNTCHPRIIPAVCWSCSAALWAIWSKYCRISRVCWRCVLTLCDIKRLCYSPITLWMWPLCASINTLYICISVLWKFMFHTSSGSSLLNSLKANQLLMFHRPLPGWLVAWSASINLLSHFNDLCSLPETLLLLHTETVHRLDHLYNETRPQNIQHMQHTNSYDSMKEPMCKHQNPARYIRTCFSSPQGTNGGVEVLTYKYLKW